MPEIQIPGVGWVTFPDTMTAEEISAAAKKLIAQAEAPAEPAPVAEEPGFVGRMGRQLVSPIEPVRAGAHRLANLIDITPREATPAPSLIGSIKEMAGGIKENPVEGTFKAVAELTGVPSIFRAGKAAYEAAPAFIEQPAAALRGMTAGTVEGLGELTPLDYLMLSTLKKGKAATGERAATRGASSTRPSVPRRIAPEDLEDIAAQVGRISEKATGTASRPIPRDLSPSLVASGGRRISPRAGGPASSYIRQAIEEPLDRQAAAAQRRLRLSNTGGRVADRSIPTVEETLQSALEDLRTADTSRARTLAPSEPAPMPRTGGIARGRTIEEPGGALGVAEDSVASARRALTAREARARELDRMAEQQVRRAERELNKNKKAGAVKLSGGPAVPGTASERAYAAGRTPAEAGAARAAEAGKGTEAALAVEMPGKVVQRIEQRVGARTEGGAFKATLRRDRLGKELKRVKVEDPRLQRKIGRFNWLREQKYDEMSETRKAEMAKLEREILGNEELPQKIRSQWERVNKDAEVAAAAAAKASQPVTERAARLVKEVAPPPVPREPIPAEVSAASQAEILRKAGAGTGTGATAETGGSSIGRAAGPEELALVRRGEEAGIGPPPRGVDPVDWARINAVEVEARTLWQENEIADPRLLREMRDFWGAEETARRLRLPKGKAGTDMVRDLAGGPKRKPYVALAAEAEDRLRRLVEDPRGFMRTEALVAGAGAAAGGLAGLTIEDEDGMDRLAYGISGAIIGGLAGWAGAKGINRLVEGGPGGWKEAANTMEALDTANLLAGPAVVKTSLGSTGGVAAGLWQRIQEGRAGNVHSAALAREGMKFITSRDGMVKVYWDTLTAPTRDLGPIGTYSREWAGRLGFFSTTANRLTLLARNVLRPFIASDRAGSAVLKRMGFSAEESSRLMLIGEPTSWQGQAALNAVNASFVTRMLVKFPRVRVAGLERGIEYTPILGKRVKVRHTRGEVPRFFRGGFEEKELLSEAAGRARRQFGGAAMVAGTVYGYLEDPSLTKGGIVSSAAGPAFLPAAAGIAAGKALRHGANPLEQMLLEAVRSVPQIQEGSISTSELSRRATPLRPLRRLLGESE